MPGEPAGCRRTVHATARSQTLTQLRQGPHPLAARFLLDAAGFFADHGVPGECAFTDRAFTSTQAYAFREAMASLGARHRPRGPPIAAVNNVRGNYS